LFWLPKYAWTKAVLTTMNLCVKVVLMVNNYTNKRCCDVHEFVCVRVVLMVKNYMNKGCCDSHEFMCVGVVLMA